MFNNMEGRARAARNADAESSVPQSHGEYGNPISAKGVSESHLTDTKPKERKSAAHVESQILQQRAIELRMAQNSEPDVSAPHFFGGLEVHLLHMLLVVICRPKWRGKICWNNCLEMSKGLFQLIWTKPFMRMASF